MMTCDMTHPTRILHTFCDTSIISFDGNRMLNVDCRVNTVNHSPVSPQRNTNNKDNRKKILHHQFYPCDMRAIHLPFKRKVRNKNNDSYFLGRDLVGGCPHVNLLVNVHTRDDEEHARAPRSPRHQATQPEDDGSLVLLQFTQAGRLVS